MDLFPLGVNYLHNSNIYMHVSMEQYNQLVHPFLTHQLYE